MGVATIERSAVDLDAAKALGRSWYAQAQHSINPARTCAFYEAIRDLKDTVDPTSLDDLVVWVGAL